MYQLGPRVDGKENATLVSGIFSTSNHDMFYNVSYNSVLFLSNLNQPIFTGSNVS